MGKHPSHEELVAYLLAQGQPGERRGLDRHLERCSTCSTEVEQMRKVSHRLRRELEPLAAEQLPTEEFISRVKEILRSSEDRSLHKEE